MRPAARRTATSRYEKRARRRTEPSVVLTGRHCNTAQTTTVVRLPRGRATFARTRDEVEMNETRRYWGWVTWPAYYDPALRDWGALRARFRRRVLDMSRRSQAA